VTGFWNPTGSRVGVTAGRAPGWPVTELDVLPAFGGTVVHDALSVYDAYPGARHALCGAHISPELVAAGETDPDQAWPAQALRALHGLNTAAHHARDQQLPAIPPETAQPLLDSWRPALLVGLAEHRRAPGRRQSTTATCSSAHATATARCCCSHAISQCRSPTTRPSATSAPPRPR
jgi:hypothetical protein